MLKPNPLLLKFYQWLVDYLKINPIDDLFLPCPGNDLFAQILEGSFKIEKSKDHFSQHEFILPFDLILGTFITSDFTGYIQLLDHCSQNLTDDGRLVFIFPWKMAFNNEEWFQEFLPHLAEVILLPRKLFPLKEAVFIFHKQPVLATFLKSYTAMTTPKKLQLENYL